MPGRDPGIHEADLSEPVVDAHGSSPWAEGPRDKPGHDACIARTQALRISALTGDGVDELLAALRQRIEQAYRIEAPVLTRARHLPSPQLTGTPEAVTTDLNTLTALGIRIAVNYVVYSMTH